MSAENVLDALVVGAGFGGLYCLHQLRKEGFVTKLFEAGSGMGGTWFWNRYPGARVDSDFPLYQFGDKELWDFDWTERFPGHAELRRYFEHVDRKLNLSKDIQFNTCVTAAAWDGSNSYWLVQTSFGQSVKARHLFLCVGSTWKAYTPPFKGIQNFKGEIHHSSAWPESRVDYAGRRVAVIGTGASGVQIIQEVGPTVAHLTVYQRTPNLAIPMRQYPLHGEGSWKCEPKEDYHRIFRDSFNTYSGLVLDMDWNPKKAMDATPEERQELYEHLWNRGGFAFWVGTFHDILYNQEANETAYKFWCSKTRARIIDPVKKDLLAPVVPPHPFGTKRPCLEQRYYEVYNQENVDLFNIRESPILEITDKGIITEKEGLTEVDIIILATGFDNLTGSLLNIKLTNGKGQSLQEYWKNGTSTYLGLSIAGFPNCYFTYGPQGPTPFCSGIASAAIQGGFAIKLMTKMRNEKLKIAEAQAEAENQWTTRVRDLWESSLFPLAESWYQGANIPGKKKEALAYVGGLPKYIKELEQCAKNNYEGFALA